MPTPISSAVPVSAGPSAPAASSAQTEGAPRFTRARAPEMPVDGNRSSAWVRQRIGAPLQQAFQSVRGFGHRAPGGADQPAQANACAPTPSSGYFPGIPLQAMPNLHVGDPPVRHPRPFISVQGPTPREITAYYGTDPMAVLTHPASRILAPGIVASYGSLPPQPYTGPLPDSPSLQWPEPTPPWITRF
jgi:hypothetical protein